MDHEEEIKTKESLIDKIVRYFMGGFCLLMGLMGLVLIPIEQTNFFPYFLAFVFTPLGLAVCSPKVMAPKIKVVLAYPFKPLTKRLKGVDASSNIEKLFENKIALGIFFLAFCALEVWGLGHIEDGRWWICLAGAIMFGVMGIYSLFPNFTVGLGVLIAIGLVLALFFGGTYLAYKSFGATPVAIVIGAMIIASAIKQRY